jgi:anti-sigma factor RsiW
VARAALLQSIAQHAACTLSDRTLVYRPSQEQQPRGQHCARAERRRSERRQQGLRALVHGSLRPRRRAPRRVSDRALSAVDWHHAQWLAIALLIVLFSCGDSFLTLLLVERGAREVNPLMAPLVAGSAATFAGVKIALTGAGVVLLTQLARIRAFGRIPVGVLLYLVLALYSALMFYEFHLLGVP